MPEQTFGWQTLCEAAILETNPDKLAICIGAAEQAIRSTRITCGYYRTRALQVGGCPFSAQDLEQNFFAVEGQSPLERRYSLHNSND